MADEIQRSQSTLVTAKVAHGGLQLTEFQQMWDFATVLVKAKVVPASLDEPGKVIAAIQSGAELGMPPMRALNSFYVVNGKCSLYGDAPLALVRESGKLEWIKEGIEGQGDNRVAWCETMRVGATESARTEYSVAEAKQAGSWKKDIWQKYPQRMLKFKARSWNLRDNFPDVLSGAPIYEDIADAEDVAAVNALPRPDGLSREQAALPEAKPVSTQQATETASKSLLASFSSVLKESLPEDVAARLAKLGQSDKSRIFIGSLAAWANATVGDVPDIIWSDLTTWPAEVLVNCNSALQLEESPNIDTAIAYIQSALKQLPKEGPAEPDTDGTTITEEPATEQESQDGPEAAADAEPGPSDVKEPTEQSDGLFSEESPQDAFDQAIQKARAKKKGGGK